MGDKEKPQRVADYFVVTGLGKTSKPSDVDKLGGGESTFLEPITDLAVIFKSLGEKVPSGYTLIDKSPAGFPADLNHGSIRQPSCFLCFKRGLDKPPLTDIGVLYDGKERLMSGCDIITETPYGKSANVNNSGGSRTFITYRRASHQMAHTSLAVTEICVIVASKGEKPPHAFCLIDRNLNKGMVGSDVFLCYRKSLSRSTSIMYQPEILSRFPPEDHEDFPLPEQVPMFCLPFGTIIQCWPEKCQHPLPSFSTFVLTGASGQKIYGAAVTFFEILPDELTSEHMKKALRLDELREENETVNLHTNKCICILSHWPFFEAFKKFLSQLYRISVSAQPIPIEKYIANLMLDVPFPSPKRPRILIEMTRYDPFEITQLYHTPLPVSGASYTAMLRYLGPDNVLLLFYLVLTEHKILFHSLRPALLTSVAEALTTILFPFTWQCPYIPLCPVALNDVLYAPCPFIIGIDSRYFDQYDPPDDVTSVDLDTNMVSLASEIKPVSWKSLPKKPGKVLKDRLTELFYQMYQQYHKEKETFGADDTAIELAPLDHDNTRSRKRLGLEVSIQEACLRFMGTILKGYGNYLLPITSAPTEGTCDMSSLFDIQGFLKSRPSSYQKFFNLLIHTQMFSRFIEQRSFVTDQDSLLAFFDTCTEKLDEPKPLIQVDESAKGGQRTFVVTPPNADLIDKGKLYTYPTFPILNIDLFKRDQPNPNPEPVVNSPDVITSTTVEKKDGQHTAEKDEKVPADWAKCLFAYCYTLWFIHLPAYVKSHHNKAKVLHVAFEVLGKLEKKKVTLPDQVSYRVLMYLCGQYGLPALAVKVLFEMKRQKITPNAVTYGFYNRAVVEGKWPSNTTSAHLWNKVRNFFAAVHEFRKLAQNRQIAREGSMSPWTSSSDVDTPDSPTKNKPRSRTPKPATDNHHCHEPLLIDSFNHQLVDSPDINHKRPRTVSGMSMFSEPGDLNVSMSSIDGFPSTNRTRHYSRTSSEPCSDGSRHSRLFFSSSREGVDYSMSYEDTTMAMDDYVFGLPHGLKPDTALEAMISSCFQCVKCERYLHEEEILSGWTANDSDLNTSCSFCTTRQVAILTIKVKDYRNCFSSRPNSDLTASMSSLGSPDFPSGYPKLGNTNSFSGLLPNDVVVDDDDDGDIFEIQSKSVPKTIEAGLMMPKGSPPMTNHSPPSSNPMQIRSMRPSISAPSSANVSPSGSFHGSPRQPGLFPSRPRNSNSTCSHSSHWFVTRPPEERDSITVAYISPLVLRKELENMLENDGYKSLQSPDIVHQKDILYWNLVWVFKRLELPSHLSDLLLASYPGDKPDKEERRANINSEVLISTSWDADRQELDYIPLYILWNSPVDQQAFTLEKIFTSRSVMQSVVAHVQMNDVINPIKILIDERNRQRAINPQIRWSVYRELLFLSLTVCGTDRIDVEAYEREYRRAYRDLRDSKDYSDKLIIEDSPMKARSVYCRRLFSNPTLQPKLPQYGNQTQLI